LIYRILYYRFIFIADTSTRLLRVKTLSRQILELMIVNEHFPELLLKKFSQMPRVFYEPVNRIALFISLSGKLDLASLAIAFLTAFPDDLLVLSAFYYRHRDNLLPRSLQQA